MKNSSIKLGERFAPRDETAYIVVHHSATKADHEATAEDIHRWHLARGWSGIGYNVVIERSGAVRIGRPVRTQGAHVKGHNHESVGLCMVGGLDDKGKVVDNFTPEQYLSLESVLILLREIFPEAEVVKHKDLADTLCNAVNLKKTLGE